MATNNKDTVYNKAVTDNSEDTQLVQNEENQTETATGKKRKTSWKQVTIGGVSGILLGASSVFFTSSSSATNDPDVPVRGDTQPSPDGGTPVSPDSHVSVDGLPVATVSDDLSFSEAFAEARQEVGAGGVFEWHGGVYGTYYANEWEAMTPEQRAEFGSHISYGNTNTGTEMADTEPNNSINDDVTPNPAGEHTTATHETYTPAQQQDEPEIVAVSTQDENDVQIVGVEDVTFEDGSVVTMGQVTIGGDDVYFVDVDHDGTFDIAGTDMNGDGMISENEIADIHDQGLMVSDLGNPMGMTDPANNLYADLPDYTNDAETSGLA